MDHSKQTVRELRMDHIGQTVRGEPMKIPIFESTDYQGNDFYTYPEKERWGSRSAKEWDSIFANPPQGFQAFLQRWLFFGVLAEVFKDQVSTRCFRTRDGDLTINLLPILVERKLDFDEDRVRLDKVYEFLLSVNRILACAFGTQQDQLAELRKQEDLREMTLLECLEKCLMPNILGSEMLMSIHLVSEFLMSIATFRHLQLNFPGKSKPVFFQGFSDWWTSLPSNLLRKDGWCISELPVLFGQFNTSSLLYLTSLSAPTYSQSVAKTGTRSSSCCSSCSELECLSRKLNEDSYLTRHVDACCNCNNFIAKPVGILKDLSVPLVTAISNEDESCEVRLVPRTPELTYVAISHVWSDGLGNVKDNALPHCQLMRLSKLIDQSSTSLKYTYLWLDTLCVPPDMANQVEAQRFAMEKMGETYENAEAVLVLDSWLLSSKLESRPDEEILTQIFASHWNRRLWTFQEGALAKSLYFQFSDGPYSLDQGIQRLEGSKDLIKDHTLRPAIFARNWSLRRFVQSGQKRDEHAKISSLFATFRYRQTSVASDEALCLGTILGLETSNILRAMPEERMQIFWSMIRKVPVDVLFYNGPTFDKEGFRWAPRTLLRSIYNTRTFEEAYSHTDEYLDKAEPCATVTGKGLSVELAGLLFTSGEISSQAYIDLQHASDPKVVYRFKPSQPDGEGRPKSSPCFSGRLAFILNGERPEMGKRMDHQGILAAVESKDRHVINVVKKCNGSCETLTTELHQDKLHDSRLQDSPARGTLKLPEENSNVPTKVMAKWTKPKQKWIVN